MASVFCIVVAGKFALAFAQDGPVAHLDLCSVTSTLFLLLHLDIEASLIDRHIVLTTNEFGKVEWEAEGVEQLECLLARNDGLASSLHLVHHVGQQFDTISQCTQESIFLFLHHLHDEFFLSSNLRECLAHLGNQRWHELIDERLFLVEERITITNSTTEDTTNDIAGLRVAWQLSVSN